MLLPNAPKIFDDHNVEGTHKRISSDRAIEILFSGDQMFSEALLSAVTALTDFPAIVMHDGRFFWVTDGADSKYSIEQSRKHCIINGSFEHNDGVDVADFWTHKP